MVVETALSSRKDNPNYCGPCIAPEVMVSLDLQKRVGFQDAYMDLWKRVMSHTYSSLASVVSLDLRLEKC